MVNLYLNNAGIQNFLPAAWLSIYTDYLEIFRAEFSAKSSVFVLAAILQNLL